MRFRLGIRASSAGASVKSRPVEQSGGSGRSGARVLCRKLRRFSCAVATSRVGDRSPTSRPSGREVRHRRCWPTGLFFLQIRSVLLLIGQPAPFLGHFQQRRTVLAGREALGHETAITRNPPILIRSNSSQPSSPVE
jgi:hypothetical protein